MSAPQPTPGPDLDYAIAQYHREKEARRNAQREVERLREAIAYAIVQLDCAHPPARVATELRIELERSTALNQ